MKVRIKARSLESAWAQIDAESPAGAHITLHSRRDSRGRYSARGNVFFFTVFVPEEVDPEPDLGQEEFKS